MSQFMKVAVLGASGVGKTSLIRRFSHNDFVDTEPFVCTCQNYRGINKSKVSTPESDRGHIMHELPEGCFSRPIGVSPRLSGTSEQLSVASLPTSKRYQEMLLHRCTCQRPRPACKTVVWGTPGSEINLVNLSVLDVPYMETFPADTLQEFDTEGARGVRSASVFVMVFDVTKPETFDYVARIRDEIKKCCSGRVRHEASHGSVRKHSEVLEGIWPISSRVNSSSVGLLGCKRMRVGATRKSIIPFAPLISEEQFFSGGRSTSGVKFSDDNRTSLCNGTVEPVFIVIGNKFDHLYDTEDCTHGYDYRSRYRDFVNTIRKTWKCHYTECSAKYGYNVKQAFLAAVDSVLVARGRRKKTKAPKHRGFRP